ncbi:MAG: hypothetical protein ACYDHH_00380 [Solirubrobacteraceae bacterium]
MIHTIVQDDDLALFTPSLLKPFIRQLKSLGVDQLRISAEWKIEAPNPNGSSRPTYFNASDPHSYDHSSGMQALDRAVRAAAAGGLGVILDPAFSAPRWATSNPRPGSLNGDPWYNRDINVGELVRWEAMLARRYSGHYTPKGASSPLPLVRTFTLWNEPNQSGFLAPQWHGRSPVSADWYRRVLRAAFPAIKRFSPSAQILIGNTSATGADQQAGNTGVPPFQFIRRLACVTKRLRPIHTGRCAGFTKLPADGYAQHPYERNAPPWQPGPTGHGYAQMGDLEALQRLLGRLVAMHRLARGAANVWLTEQGYQTDELQRSPWTPTQQAQLNADSEYLAWRDPHVRSFSQFLLRDTLVAQTRALRARTNNARAQLPGTWTTGLEHQDGSPKPALAMFRTPIVARMLGARARRVEVWGRVRPQWRRTPVVIEASGAGGGGFIGWRELARTSTGPDGIFDVRVVIPAPDRGAIRFRWLDSGGNWLVSPQTRAVHFTSGPHPIASIY